MRSEAQHRLGRVEAILDGDAKEAEGAVDHRKTWRTTMGSKRTDFTTGSGRAVSPDWHQVQTGTGMAMKRKRKRLKASKGQACKPGKQGPCDFEAATWNLGGMAAEKICDIIRLFDDLGQGKVGILAMQGGHHQGGSLQVHSPNAKVELELGHHEEARRVERPGAGGQAQPEKHRGSGDGRSRHRICSARISRQNWSSGFPPSPESNPTRDRSPHQMLGQVASHEKEEGHDFGDANETFMWSGERAGGPVRNTARGSMLPQG